MATNPNAMLSAAKNSIFTNTGLTPDGDIWWEGIGHDMPAGTINWKNKVHDAASGEPCAHANARFTAPASQCPCIDEKWEDPAGVPIEAILFGGRRPSTVPLVQEAFSWAHGVFIGSVVGSEITAAAIGLKTGTVRRDPFAMLPFCGYNMGDYFQHWLNIEKNAPDASKLPGIYYVNWFRKSADGKWLWPGYGDNIRVLKWIFERLEGNTEGVKTAIGYLPKPEGIDVSGIEDVKENLPELLSVEPEKWKTEIDGIKEHYTKFGAKLPKALKSELADLEKRLGL
jgi:phosphoenolpyruvate carboxykinase (GTP)